MEITKDHIIGEFVDTEYQYCLSIKKYGIDFCCQGNRTTADDTVKEKH